MKKMNEMSSWILQVIRKSAMRQAVALSAVMVGVVINNFWRARNETRRDIESTTRAPVVSTDHSSDDVPPQKSKEILISSPGISEPDQEESCYIEVLDDTSELSSNEDVSPRKSNEILLSSPGISEPDQEESCYIEVLDDTLELSSNDSDVPDSAVICVNSPEDNISNTSTLGSNENLFLDLSRDSNYNDQNRTVYRNLIIALNGIANSYDSNVEFLRNALESKPVPERTESADEKSGLLNGESNGSPKNALIEYREGAAKSNVILAWEMFFNSTAKLIEELEASSNRFQEKVFEMALGAHFGDCLDSQTMDIILDAKKSSSCNLVEVLPEKMNGVGVEDEVTPNSDEASLSERFQGEFHVSETGISILDKHEGLKAIVDYEEHSNTLDSINGDFLEGTYDACDMLLSLQQELNLTYLRIDDIKSYGFSTFDHYTKRKILDLLRRNTASNTPDSESNLLDNSYDIGEKQSLLEFSSNENTETTDVGFRKYHPEGDLDACDMLLSLQEDLDLSHVTMGGMKLYGYFATCGYYTKLRVVDLLRRNTTSNPTGRESNLFDNSCDIGENQYLESSFNKYTETTEDIGFREYYQEGIVDACNMLLSLQKELHMNHVTIDDMKLYGYFATCSYYTKLKFLELLRRNAAGDTSGRENNLCTNFYHEDLCNETLENSKYFYKKSKISLIREYLKDGLLSNCVKTECETSQGTSTVEYREPEFQYLLDNSYDNGEKQCLLESSFEESTETTEDIGSGYFNVSLYMKLRDYVNEDNASITGSEKGFEVFEDPERFRVETFRVDSAEFQKLGALKGEKKQSSLGFPFRKEEKAGRISNQSPVTRRDIDVMIKNKSTDVPSDMPGQLNDIFETKDDKLVSSLDLEEIKDPFRPQFGSPDIDRESAGKQLLLNFEDCFEITLYPVGCNENGCADLVQSKNVDESSEDAEDKDLWRENSIKLSQDVSLSLKNSEISSELHSLKNDPETVEVKIDKENLEDDSQQLKIQGLNVKVECLKIEDDGDERVNEKMKAKFEKDVGESKKKIEKFEEENGEKDDKKNGEKFEEEDDIEERDAEKKSEKFEEEDDIAEKDDKKKGDKFEEDDIEENDEVKKSKKFGGDSSGACESNGDLTKGKAGASLEKPGGKAGKRQSSGGKESWSGGYEKNNGGGSKGKKMGDEEESSENEDKKEKTSESDVEESSTNDEVESGSDTEKEESLNETSETGQNKVSEKETEDMEEVLNDSESSTKVENIPSTSQTQF